MSHRTSSSAPTHALDASTPGNLLVKVAELTLVLITGASVGIGAATAKLFAKAGSNLILVARRADKLAEVKKEAESLGKGKVVLIEADMQKREDLDAILGKTEGLTVDM